MHVLRALVWSRIVPTQSSVRLVTSRLFILKTRHTNDKYQASTRLNVVVEYFSPKVPLQHVFKGLFTHDAMVVSHEYRKMKLTKA